MSVLDCIAKLSALKKLDKKTETELLDFLTNDQKLDLQSATFQQQLAGVTRALQKKADAKVMAIKQTLTTAKLHDLAMNHPEGLYKGSMAILSHDSTGKAPYANAWTRAQSLTYAASGRLGKWIDKFGPKLLGFGEDTKGMEDVILALRGGQMRGANAAAKDFAAAYTDVTEWLRRQALDAGSAIAKRADWGSPQHHSNVLIKGSSLQEYKDFVRPTLDYSRIYGTNGQLMSVAQVDLVLDELHQSAMTNGASLLTPGGSGKRSLANQWTDSRVLAFTPDGFLKYNEKYGEPDLLKLLVGHVQALAHDVGVMQVMGPNPDFTYKYIRDLIKQSGRESTRMYDARYAVISGAVNEGNGNAIARVGQSLRNVLSAGLLSSAPISQIGDFATVRAVTNLRGLHTARTLEHFGKLMTQTPRGRAFAGRIGAANEMFLSELHAASRFTEINSTSITGKIADKVFRAGLLTPTQHALKAAVGVEFMQSFAEQAGKRFDQLPTEFKQMFKEYGVTSAHWDVVRKAPMIQGEGPLAGVRALDFANMPTMSDAELTALKLKRADVQEAFRRFTDIVTTEVDGFAVPTPDAGVKAITSGGLAAGTIEGQAWRTVMLFKSFPFAQMMGHMRRGWAQPGMSKATYLGALGLTLTVAGAIRNQVTDVLKGNDPQNMWTPKFWGGAFLQGGGLGLYGDFLYGGLMGSNRYDNNALVTALGPGASFAEDTGQLLLGNFAGVLRGDNTTVGKDVTRMLRMYTPDVWYTRLAMDRLIWDQLQYFIDPDANKSWGRMMRKQLKEREQESWWESGELSPERLPNLGAAIQ
jgi:hypothetical protein